MIRKLQPSFASGELAPSMYGRTDLAKWMSGLKTCHNFIIRPQGGAENRSGTYYTGPSPGAGRLISFSYNVEQSYFLEFTDGLMRVIKDGGLVLRPLSVAADYQWSASGSGTNEYYLEAAGGGDPSLLQPASDEVYENDVAIPSGTLGSLAAGEWAFGDNDTLGYNTLYVRLSDGADPDSKGDEYIACVSRTTSPYAVADLALMKFTQSADTMFIQSKGYAQRTLVRSDHHEWTFSVVSFSPTVSAPTGLAGTSPGSGRTMNYKVSAVVNGEESLPCSAVAVAVNSPWTAGDVVGLSWNTVSGAEVYNVYKSSRGYYGWIGTTESPAYTDDNVDPDVSDGPVAANNPFAGSNYPGAGGIFEQRMVYAGSSTNPQTFWLSRTGFLANFSISRPLKDSDAIEVSIASRQVNEIRHIVPLDKLIILTSGAEWVADSGEGGGGVTPTSIRLRIQSYRGASDVPPLVIGSTVLFVQRDGATVQNLGYSFASDKYEAHNLSVLSQHLFAGRTIKEWAYQQRPNSVIWCVMSDGALLSFTYLEEHEVWAWARHSTDGEFVSVAAIPGLGGEDEVMFQVKRTVDGSDVYYLEYLTERLPDEDMLEGVFVDSALTYDGVAATVMTGLDHLEGETVWALADGSVQKDLTVSGGSVTIPFAATKIHVGLPIPTPTIELLPLEIPEAQGRKRRVNKIFVRLENSRGFWAGPTTAKMVEAKWRTNEDYGEPTRLFSGDKELLLDGNWGLSGTVVIQQRDPLPLSINSVAPEIDIGG